MVNVGLVGFGLSGRVFHAPVIGAVTGMRMAGILQRSGDAAAKLYPEAKLARSLSELLSIPELHLVVVATPNVSHFGIAKACLEHGRHVVIDKPFTTTTQEAQLLVAMARSRGKLLSVYHNRRWDGDFQTVSKVVAGDSLGRIVSYESHFDRYRPGLRADAWRERDEPGSGLLFDLGPHLLDQAMYLFGVPNAIEADVRRERDGAVADDAFAITLFYPKLRASLRATALATSPGPRFAIRGTLGSYLKYGMDPQEDLLKQGDKPGGEQWGIEDKAMWGTLRVARGAEIVGSRVPTLAGDYRLYYENVRDAIEGKVPLAVTSEQAEQVVMALELANKSSKEGRRVDWSGPQQ